MIAVRNAEPRDAEAMARIQVAGWQHAYAGFMPKEFIAARDLALRTGEWRARLAAPAAGTIHLVAEAASTIAAITSGGPPLGDEVTVEGSAAEFTAQVYGLYVDPKRLSRGIGRRLLGELARRLAAANHSNLVLWAFAENPYRRFYERLGGRQIARGIWTIEGIELVELAYGWRDIGLLIEACFQGATTE